MSTREASYTFQGHLIVVGRFGPQVCFDEATLQDTTPDELHETARDIIERWEVSR